MDSGLTGTGHLVTGASGGIGSACARALAEAGANVGLHHHHGVEAAAELRSELHERHGVEAPPLRADLRDELEVDRMFEYCDEALGGLDGLVVNAGVWPATDVGLDQMSLEQWNDTLAVNLTGAFLCCRAFLRGLRRKPREHAAIVLIGSTAGLFGEEGHADYAASKAALVGLCLSLKNEIVRLAPRGRVNVVHPGWVATPMAAEALEDRERVDRVTSTMALRKVATPDDVARAVVFLLSSRLAGHLTGVQLPLSGGMEGRLLHPGTDPAGTER